MKSSLRLSLTIGLVMTSFAAFASGGGGSGGGGGGGSGGPTRISTEQGRANNAQSFSPTQCMSMCGNGPNCSNNCRVNQCYHNTRTGRFYCVDRN